MKTFLHTYNLKNLVKSQTCFKNVNNPRTIDLILTNKNKCFFHNDVIDNEVLISNENELAETFNSYFSNIALKLDSKDMGNYNLDNGDISNPMLMAINKYAEHPSIVAIKICVSSVKHSFSILSQQDILKVVQDIDVSKATASHNIPTRIFKENIDIY